MTTARDTGRQGPVVVFGWLGALISIAVAAALGTCVIAATQPRKPAPAQVTIRQQPHLAKVAP